LGERVKQSSEYTFWTQRFTDTREPISNECLSSPCDVNGECTNNVGSFICKCNIGYSGNGFTCEGKIDVL
jgi:hypothetical protein